MNRYEIFWGDETYYQEASTPYQACMLVLKDRVCVERKQVILAPFIVINLSNLFSEQETMVELETIIRLRQLSNEYIELSDIEEPALDPNCELVLAAMCST